MGKSVVGNSRVIEGESPKPVFNTSRNLIARPCYHAASQSEMTIRFLMPWGRTRVKSDKKSESVEYKLSQHYNTSEEQIQLMTIVAHALLYN